MFFGGILYLSFMLILHGGGGHVIALRCGRPSRTRTRTEPPVSPGVNTEGQESDVNKLRGRCVG